MDPLQMELTVKDMTVDQLYEELGRLRSIGWGVSLISWHTTRTHIGTGITMSLALNRDDRRESDSGAEPVLGGFGATVAKKPAPGRTTLLKQETTSEDD